ncbi:hypothetical protein DL93DRAFT_2104407 [Clavulina sp. PMI_390]|nr:hypothetical protein DL93DRAFT_2104407 [Clavulina sp. PMI_390]
MSLPFDSSDPQVRLLLKHVRLQALTPMAVLINLTATIICALVLTPSTERIAEIYATPFNSQPYMLGLYWLGTSVLLIGYCFILMIATKQETKETLVAGVGMRLVFIQWLMAMNVVAFTLKWFIISLVCTSLSLALLVWVHITLYLHPVASTRPLDTAFIHAPLRLLLILTFLQDLPQVLFIVLGWHFNLVKDEQDYDKWGWQAVAFIVSFNLVGLLEVGWRLDFVWAAAGLWLTLGQLTQRPKAAQVFTSSLAFAVLYPVVFIASVFIWRGIQKRRALEAEGAIRLPEEDDEAIVGGLTEEEEVARVRARAHANATNGGAA